jgi:Transcriptional regulator, AbiEi antitoxin, Type IV TA system/Transcriptional regulator, AbiEi antitoxin N-terminal domain
MGLQNDSRLNSLTRLLPEGVAAPSSWLQSQGFSRQLVRKYVQSGWLNPLARGVFARPTQPLDADAVLMGLQRLANAPFHIGGVSALNRLGHAHYLPLGGEADVHLWGQGSVPAWVTAISLRERLVFHRTRLFDERARTVGIDQIPTRVRDWKLTLSGLERAIMEVLSLVDEHEATFTHAAQLFEGLTVLRPSVVNELLVACASLKVKRLFLFLSAHYRYPWAEKLDRSAVDLGKGKRLIVRGGRYDPEFRITVPERFGAER